MHSFDFLEKYSQSHCLQYKTNNNFFFAYLQGQIFHYVLCGQQKFLLVSNLLLLKFKTVDFIYFAFNDL